VSRCRRRIGLGKSYPTAHIARFACIIIIVRAHRGGVAREILFGGGGGRGRGHEARKVKELDERVRLFFASASKNSAAGAVVSRCAHGGALVLVALLGGGGVGDGS